jgi:hypothetical protein
MAHFVARPRQRRGEPAPLESWSELTGDFHCAVPDLPGGIELAITEDGRDL